MEIYNLCILIPTLNEEGSIAFVLNSLLKFKNPNIKNTKVIVCDYKSEDNTVQIAKDLKAKVVNVKNPGYGSALLEGLKFVDDKDIVLFLDADGADDLLKISEMIDLIINDTADLVIGSRVLGEPEKGALSVPQRFGNLLVTKIIGIYFKQSCTDLGPQRMIIKETLNLLNMSDPDFGWTIEMQIKAYKQRLKVVEIPVNYKCRFAGVSKISNNLKGSFFAGKKILYYVFKELIFKKK